MRIKPLLRRLLSLNILTVWSSLYHLLPFTSSTTKARKHIKIDDEEQDLHSDSSSYFSTPRDRTRIAKVLEMLLVILFILIPLILIVAYTIYKPPFFVIRFLQARAPSLIYHVSLPSSSLSGTKASPNRMVALTIDDAPSEHTAHILSLLERYNAHATFFVIGSQIAYSTTYPGLLEKIVEGGNEVGNHAWTDTASVSLPLSTLTQHITQTASLLPPNPSGAKYFRPGSGFFNAAMVKLVEGMGYKIALGSIYAHDAQIQNPKRNARHILSMVHEGGVIIMHDRRDYSLEQLELVLRGLQEGGWRVESLGGLVGAAESAWRDVGKAEERGKRRR